MNDAYTGDSRTEPPSAPGLLAQILVFLRADIAETSAAIDNLSIASDGLFGPVPMENGVAATGDQPSCAASEILSLLDAKVAVRNRLHQEVHRLTSQL